MRMMSSKLFFYNLLLLLVFSLSVDVFARRGHDENNGGDHIRATFIKVGERVLNFLSTTDQGLRLTSNHNLSLEMLRSTLSINVVSVESGPLIDNQGSIVDALGESGRIVLDHDKWFEHFEKDRDIYYLVFHEMLRAVSVDDDDYIISRGLNPFTSSMKITTHVGNRFSLQEGELLSGIIQDKAIAITGSGCPANSIGSGGLYADFDYERNILDIFPKRYLLRLLPTTPFMRKSCMMAIPVKVPAHKRLIISQIDLSERFEMGAGFESMIQFEAFLAGSSAPLLSKRVKGVGRTLVRRTEVLASHCGGSDILRVNTSAQIFRTAIPASSEEIAWAELDRITLYLKLEDC
ncbi:MAG: DUF4360 domain-containing protein [Oligoflexia bacterium]|nr:DUF4360 domain-containing protein [Oligoflexia bacterium]MBF0365896.1 DUF4360 domain-containing protein [Oligoflexia bacterium]